MTNGITLLLNSFEFLTDLVLLRTLRTYQCSKSHNSLLLFEEARLADSSVYTVKVVMAKMCIKNPQEPVILTPSILMYTDFTFDCC